MRIFKFKAWGYFGGLCNILMSSSAMDRTTLSLIEDKLGYFFYKQMKQMTTMINPLLQEPTNSITQNFYQAVLAKYRSQNAIKITIEDITNDIVEAATSLHTDFGSKLRLLLQSQFMVNAIKNSIEKNCMTVTSNQKFIPTVTAQLKPTEDTNLPKPKSTVSQNLFGKMVNAQKPQGILGKITDNKVSQNCVNLIKKPQCLCDSFKQIKCKDESSFKCVHCNRLYHTVCMKKKSASQFCCYCHLQKMAPLKRVTKTIYVGLLKKSKKKHIANFFIPDIQASQKVQVRCLRLKEGAQLSCLFPDVAELSMNGQRCNMFQPINKQSCLKYRKDEPFNLLKGDFYKDQQNTLVVSQNIQVNKEKDIRNDPQNHVIGLYAIEDVKIEQFVNEIKLQNTLGYSQSQQILRESFGLGRDDDITCELVKIPLICPLTTAKIQIPARGVYCTHFQCFDLRNYLTLISQSQNPRWKCPLCPALAFEFQIDSILHQIIKETKLNEKIKEVLFFKNGDYSIIIDDEPLPQRKNIRSLNIPERKRQLQKEPQPMARPKGPSRQRICIIPNDVQVIDLDD